MKGQTPDEVRENIAQNVFNELKKHSAEERFVDVEAIAVEIDFESEPNTCIITTILFEDEKNIFEFAIHGLLRDAKLLFVKRVGIDFFLQSDGSFEKLKLAAKLDIDEPPTETIQ